MRDNGAFRESASGVGAGDGDERLFCVHRRRIPWLRFYLLPERFSGGFRRRFDLSLHFGGRIANETRETRPETGTNICVSRNRVVSGVCRVAEQPGDRVDRVQLRHIGDARGMSGGEPGIGRAGHHFGERHRFSDPRRYRLWRDPLSERSDGKSDVLAGNGGICHHRLLYDKERERGDDLRHRLRHRRLMVPQHRRHCISRHRRRRFCPRLLQKSHRIPPH